MKRAFAVLLICLLGAVHAQTEHPELVAEVIERAGLFLYECGRPDFPLVEVCGYTQLDITAFKAALEGLELGGPWEYHSDTGGYHQSVEFGEVLYEDRLDNRLSLWYYLSKGGLGDVYLTYRR